MKPVQKIAVYGAGGFAREVAWLISDIHKGQSPQVTCFIDDNPQNVGRVINGIPVLSLEQALERFPDIAVAVSIGSPHIRERVARKVAQASLPFVTLVHPRVEMSEFVQIGDGSIITAGNILTVNITIGQQVHINLDCTIGHDVIIEDFATLAPGVHVSGWVHIGKRVYIGTGAAIINGTSEKPLKIGSDSVIGAGAVVTKDIPPGVTAVGVPARPLGRH